jgi:hypothetical protein
MGTLLSCRTLNKRFCKDLSRKGTLHNNQGAAAAELEQQQHVAARALAGRAAEQRVQVRVRWQRLQQQQLGVGAVGGRGVRADDLLEGPLLRGWTTAVMLLHPTRSVLCGKSL